MRIRTKKLCMIAMLAALTAILAIYGTLRTDVIKISLRFLSVFLTGAMFGPLAGAAVGAMSDVVAFVANPVGPFNPLFTLNEALYGALYGLFFYRRAARGRGFYIRLALCVFIETVFIYLLLTSLFLHLTYGSEFSVNLTARAAASLINAAIHIVGICVMNEVRVRLDKVLSKR